jgi:hypothetical protein
MNTKNIWFKAKRYGWGWTPSTWQGWLVLVVFLVLVIGNTQRLQVGHATTVPIEFLVETGLLVGVLIGICYWKGEKPGRRWGK